MAELAQIGVTNDNLKCLELLKEKGFIDEIQEGARFAASIALRKQLYKNYDLENIGSKLNNRWNTSLVDPDNYFRNIVKYLNLCPKDLGIGLRSLIILGLDHIYQKINGKTDVLIGDIFDD